MKVSGAGVGLIKEFEGFPHNGRPYRDMVGVWTIGYGHTKGVGPGSGAVTEAQASELLRHELDHAYGPPVGGIGVPLHQHQFDALVSFVYNCGPGAIGSQMQIGRALRAREYARAADCLLAWNKAGGVAVAGLTRRRKAERAMFLAEDDPLEGYSPAEQRWIREYDLLRRDDRDRDRRRVLRREMAKQRQVIWRLAQPEPKGDGRGWEFKERRARYASLRSRSTA